MITEFVLVSSLAGAVKYLGSDKYKFKNKLAKICSSNSSFKNANNDTLILINYKSTEYGYKALLSIPEGLSIEDIQKQENVLKTNLNAIQINFKFMNGLLKLEVIIKPLQELKFEPIATKANEIYVGYNHKEHIKIDLNSFPHFLAGGESGSGKSRLLLIILTNLIHNHNDIQLFLVQIRKGDLGVFAKCRQTKYFARTLEGARDTLRYLNNLCIERDKKIEKYIMNGVYNIQDWNNRFNHNKMQYTYCVLDEFAFFNPSGADTKEEKRIKKEILAYIKNIVMTGRSTGIFLFTSLQKPSKSSIPSDIKAQLTTRVSFKQLDSSSSILILGNGNATGLEKREVIVRTISEEKFKTPFIDHSILMKYIKDSIELQHKYITLNKEAYNNDGTIELPKKDEKEAITVIDNTGVFNLEVLKNAK